MTNSTCDNLAKILGGKGMVENGVCMVTIDRKNLAVTIGSKPFHSLEHMFNFEPTDAEGNSLITGEMVLLESEVPGIVTAINNSGIIVSAIHNHWLFDTPKLIYIHIEIIMNPTEFARTMAGIINK